MNIRKESLNGNEYMFINEFKSTKSGFNHKTTLFKNDREIASNVSHYINRTWECYVYQSSMKCCVWKLLDECEKDFIRVYKKENNIKRLTKTKKEECMKLLKQDKEYSELEELLDRLEER